MCDGPRTPSWVVEVRIGNSQSCRTSTDGPLFVLLWKCSERFYRCDRQGRKFLTTLAAQFSIEDDEMKAFLLSYFLYASHGNLPTCRSQAT